MYLIPLRIFALDDTGVLYMPKYNEFRSGACRVCGGKTSLSDPLDSFQGCRFANGFFQGKVTCDLCGGAPLRRWLRRLL
jgi:hypothetical protein